MNNQETMHAIEFIDAAWGNKPIGEKRARVWGSELSRFGAREVMTALRMLARTSEWRPSLATIIRSIVVEPEPEHDSQAFESVVRALSLYPPGERDDKVSTATREAVRRMGGWAAVGRWDMSERNWREKEFARVFNDVRETAEARQLKGLPPAEPGARAIAGSVSEAEEPEEKQVDRAVVDLEIGKLVARLGGGK